MIIKPAKKNQKQAKKGNNKTQHIPTTIRDSIPYERVYDNGIIEIRPGVFSKTYQLAEANFKTLDDENQWIMAEKWSKFLSSFEPEVTVEVTIYNRTLDIMQFQEDVLIPMKMDNLDKYRAEYNDMLLDKIAEAKNNLESVKLITVSVPAPDVDEAVNKLRIISQKIRDSIKETAKKEPDELTIIERLEILNSIYNQDSTIPLCRTRKIQGKEVHSFTLENCYKQGITTKDAIAPGGLAFLNKKIEIGDCVAKSYFISEYPTWIKGTLLTDLAGIPTNALISAYFQTLPLDEAKKMIKRQGTNIAASIVENQKKAARSGIDASLISPELSEAKEEANELMEGLTKENERLFVANIVITLFAPNEDMLEKYEKMLKNISIKSLTSIKPLNMQQEQGFNTSLPLANDQLEIQRLMTSKTVCSIIPYDVKEVKQKTGLYYGLNAASRNLILYDRTKGTNPNGCILGMPGAGKSFSAKREMVNILLNTDDEVYVIDPEGIDYVPLAKAMNGSEVKLAAGSNIYLNPFDLNLENKDENGDPVKVKTDFIETICEIAIGGRYGLDPIDKSLIDRCAVKIYDPYVEHLRRIGKNIDMEAAPTMVDFYNMLLAQPHQQAQNIALSLERYVKGALDIFSHHSNVDIGNRFTVFNIKEIGAGMKELGLQICLDYIWNKMISNNEKGKRTWFYIDEFYLMMQKQTSAAYIAQIWKRARKWNGIPTAITQNVEDMLKSEEARTIINNCAFVVLLGQTAINRQQLSHMLGISPEEQRYISAAKPGMGLLRIDEEIVPMDDSFPKNTELYKLMTTKPSETIGR